MFGVGSAGLSFSFSFMHRALCQLANYNAKLEKVIAAQRVEIMRTKERLRRLKKQKAANRAAMLGCIAFYSPPAPNWSALQGLTDAARTFPLRSGPTAMDESSDSDQLDRVSVDSSSVGSPPSLETIQYASPSDSPRD